MKTTTFNNAFISTRWQGRVIGTLLKHSDQTEQTTFGFQQVTEVQFNLFQVCVLSGRNASEQVKSWNRAMTTHTNNRADVTAHKLCCCLEVPFQHVPFFRRWWRRMLRPPRSPRTLVDRASSESLLTNDCVTDIYTLPHVDLKMAQKNSGPFVLRYAVHGCPRQWAYLEHPPLSCLALALTVSPPSPPPGEYTLYLYFWLLPRLWFKYTCVAPSAPHKVGENVILIQRGNSQCNHREYAINWESLQSIARRVYSYTSFAVFSSLCTLSLLQLPPFYFSSVLFSFAKCLLPLAALCAPLPQPHPAAPWKKRVPPSPSLLALQIVPSLITSHHPRPSLLHPPHSPALPSPLQYFSSPATAPMLTQLSSLSSPLPTNLLTLSTSAPFPPHYLGSILICRLLPPAFPPLTCFRFTILVLTAKWWGKKGFACTAWKKLMVCHHQSCQFPAGICVLIIILC